MLQLQSLRAHFVCLTASFQEQRLSCLTAFHNGHGAGQPGQDFLQQQRFVLFQLAKTGHFHHPEQAFATHHGLNQQDAGRGCAQWRTYMPKRFR
ncbi:hypothetical protein D9M71_798960 [compost metagenome]